MCSDGKLTEQPFGNWSSLLPDGCSNRKVFLSNVQITCTAVMSRSPLQASTYKVITTFICIQDHTTEGTDKTDHLLLILSDKRRR